jgi:predicted component of type VI protein secretion system
VLAAALGTRLPRSLPLADETVFSGGEQKPAAARLLVTAGPQVGAEFRIVDPLTTLGRAARNAIAIPDISVSREHLTVERKGDAFILLDRESGNGTRINGRWRRRRRLRHGDEIEIGDTALRFLEPGGVIACAPGAGRPAAIASLLRPRTSVAAALALAIMLVLAAAAVRRQRLTGELAARAQRDAIHGVALQKLEEGRSLVKEGRPAEGRGRLAVAAELDGADAQIAGALQATETEDARAQAADAQPIASAPAGAYPPSPVAQPIRRASPGRGRPRDGAATARPAAAAFSDEVEGRRALAARHVLAAGDPSADADLPGAAAHLRAAVESDPDNREARAGLSRIAERAKEVYLRAYMVKDDDPDAARSGFRLVIEALPASDETAVKAMRWLRKLDAKGAD